jgi:hypothetical protein
VNFLNVLSKLSLASSTAGLQFAVLQALRERSIVDAAAVGAPQVRLATLVAALQCNNARMACVERCQALFAEPIMLILL